jgi:hypothetical protein
MTPLLLSLLSVASAQSINGEYDLTCQELELAVTASLRFDSAAGSLEMALDVPQVPTSCEGTETDDLDDFETDVYNDCQAAGIWMIDCATVAELFVASVEDFETRRDEMIPSSITLAVGTRFEPGHLELYGDHAYADASVRSWDYEMIRLGLSMVWFASQDLYVPTLDTTDIEAIGFTCTTDTGAETGGLGHLAADGWSLENYIRGYSSATCELSWLGTVVSLDITQELWLKMGGALQP